MPPSPPLPQTHSPQSSFSFHVPPSLTLCLFFSHYFITSFLTLSTRISLGTCNLPVLMLSAGQRVTRHNSCCSGSLEYIRKDIKTSATVWQWDMGCTSSVEGASGTFKARVRHCPHSYNKSKSRSLQDGSGVKRALVLFPGIPSLHDWPSFWGNL